MSDPEEIVIRVAALPAPGTIDTLKAALERLRAAGLTPVARSLSESPLLSSARGAADALLRAGAIAAARSPLAWTAADEAALRRHIGDQSQGDN
jgi:hypothetical protein